MPGLRGIRKTAPYFHNNSAATLEEVVDHYIGVLQAREGQCGAGCRATGAEHGRRELRSATRLPKSARRSSPTCASYRSPPHQRRRVRGPATGVSDSTGRRSGIGGRDSGARPDGRFHCRRRSMSDVPSRSTSSPVPSATGGCGCSPWSKTVRIARCRLARSRGVENRRRATGRRSLASSRIETPGTLP